jgi:hypothetical protein
VAVPQRRAFDDQRLIAFLFGLALAMLSGPTTEEPDVVMVDERAGWKSELHRHLLSPNAA